MVQMMAGGAALAIAASFPVAAQVAPAGAPGIPGNPSPIGDTSAIAKEAQGWLADLIKVNTTNPPGNATLARMHIEAGPSQVRFKAESTALNPRRRTRVA